MGWAGYAADALDPPAWEPENRPPLLPHQIPPDGDWDLWLLEGGRGSGKTEGCARYYTRWMRAHPGTRGRIIAPTLGDAVESCVTGPSGLLTVDPEVSWHPSDAGGSKVRWPNGSEALVLGTPKPEDVNRLRAGGNRGIDWWEELAANPMIRTEKTEQNAWDQAQFGLRSGDRPHSIASTTPRMSVKYKAIRNLKGTVRTHARLQDNPHNNPAWRATILELYEGTRLGRQEVGGELLEDVEGALWKLEMIEHAPRTPLLVRVVVGVDPSGSATGAECGIVVAGLDREGNIYVFGDASLQGSPGEWSFAVVKAYHHSQADRVAVERNFGGDMAKHTIQTVPAKEGYPAGNAVPVKEVNASRGKELRAGPVVARYEQEHRVFHVGNLAKLEDQMTSWVPGEGPSPDRVDALVFAITSLTEPTKYRLTPPRPSRISSV